jgi:hypothetical protein
MSGFSLGRPGGASIQLRRLSIIELIILALAPNGGEQDFVRLPPIIPATKLRLAPDELGRDTKSPMANDLIAVTWDGARQRLRRPQRGSGSLSMLGPLLWRRKLLQRHAVLGSIVSQAVV